jgi:hypothetical protein
MGLNDQRQQGGFPSAHARNRTLPGKGSAAARPVPPRAASRLAKATGARLQLVHVVSHDRSSECATDASRGVVWHALNTLELSVPVDLGIEEGEPAQRLGELACFDHVGARLGWYRGSGGRLHRNWCRMPIAAGAVLAHGSTHGHETKTERARASDRRGTDSAPAAAPRDPRGASRRRSRPCRCRCVGRSRLGTGPGGRSARRSAVPRLAKRWLSSRQYGERPEPHRPPPAQASAAARGPRDDSHPLALAHWHAHRSPIA